jgi:DNA-directed RNA polymerase subunit M/transcription elongation factor TFIIS
MDTNLIECQYGHHMCSKDDFTPIGLKKKFTQCRKCGAKQARKYRTKYKEEYNNKVREYQRLYMQKKRQQQKAKTQHKQDNIEVAPEIV